MDRDNTLRVIDITNYTIHNGPGIRTLILFKGCPLHCVWCSTPESLDYSRELACTEKKCIKCGNCLESCESNCITLNEDGPVIDRKNCIRCFQCVRTCHSTALSVVGTEMTVEHLLTVIKKNLSFYRKSGGGVTLSGGEFTFMEFEAKLKLLKRLKAENINVGVDTSGFAPRQKFEQLLPYVDFFLWDIKQTDPDRHLKLTGVELEPILDNLRYVAEQGTEICLRCPMIPGFTDGEEHLIRLGELARDLPAIKEINLLPVHHYGKSRYEKIGKEYLIEDIETYSREELEKKRDLVRSFGVNAEIVG